MGRNYYYRSSISWREFYGVLRIFVETTIGLSILFVYGEVVGPSKIVVRERIQVMKTVFWGDEPLLFGKYYAFVNMFI